jgi:hypothetical protein
MCPTNKDLFGKEDRLRVPNPSGRGRSMINIEKLLLLLQAEQYTKVEIARAMVCDESTVRKHEKILLSPGPNGEPPRLVYRKEKKDFQDTVALDFEEECMRARGRSFLAWLKTKTVRYRYLFNTNRRYWVEILGRPSLVRMADDRDPLGEQMVAKWLSAIEGDKKRRRRRKKEFRYLIRFLKRGDLLEDLTMDDSRDPREVKKLPFISLPDFPPKLQLALEQLYRYDPIMGLAIKFKLATNMRTGTPDAYGVEGDDRALLGMRKGHGQSYLLMTETSFRSETIEKRRAEIRISWLPKEVRDEMRAHLETIGEGELLFDFDVDKWRNAWGEATQKHVGVRMTPHDCRKVTITWFYAMDIPLERAVEINSGWADMNTPKRHYLDYGDLMTIDERVAYQKAIPEWFKDGLDQYSRQSEYVELIALLRREGLISGNGGSSQ